MLTTPTQFSIMICRHHHLTDHKWMVFLAIIHDSKCHNKSNSNPNRKHNHPKPNSNFNPNRLSHLQSKLFLIPNTKSNNNNLNNKRKGRTIRKEGHKKKKLSQQRHGSTYLKMMAQEMVKIVINFGYVSQSDFVRE